ncbi:hypothetical protein [Pedobacter boryungensis]|uniref:IPTL-CTERM protein sorting domain-containing protein n=1 Tax=Pedobacter boryungensis TaxID=869962 RepID=A0ABX2DAZ6_9SPHI|nr:hypothetical protein [Pedobacter boryungensis]NQX30191.1 hypothetical protein [Pedobacter boryungensis]
MSKFKIIIFFTILFFLNNNSANAANGCIYASSGNLYITPTTSYNGLPTYVYNGSSDRVTSPNTVYCVQAISTNGCYIKQSSTYSLGNYVSYGPLPCPLDKYTWILIGAVIGCGCYFLYRRNILTFS